MFSYLYNIDIKSIPVLPTSSQMPLWANINARFDTDYTNSKKSESTNILAVTRSDLQRLLIKAFVYSCLTHLAN